MTPPHFDVIIVGAGLSGIGAAVHLKTRCPWLDFTILEGRPTLGGTWDLFRYPGIRSDSDMHTLGYEFKPWTEAEAIADGPAILRYLTETADEHDITRQIRSHHHVKRAGWSTEDASWTLAVTRKDTGEDIELSCRFLLMCTGYYSYRGGYQPDFVGQEDFEGQRIHPQAWPEDLDISGQRIVVIGSGATAVTLVPALADGGAEVTMLQRSPSYVAAMPRKDRVANLLRRLLPRSVAYALTRWKNIRFQQWIYRRTRSHPEQVKRHLLRQVRRELGPDFDIETHFTPRYGPWDQRLCLVPDSDFFKALRSGRAKVVTDHIERFTKGGIALRSGAELPADIIVTATGLEIVVFGEITYTVDGQPVDFSKTWTYKGIGFSGVPNLISVFGYVNASWTLRSDLICRYLCRLLSHMKQLGARQCTPQLRPEDQGMPERSWIADFSSGYLLRAMYLFPKQGDREPWQNPQDYHRDCKRLAKAPIDDGVMRFTNTEP